MAVNSPRAEGRRTQAEDRIDWAERRKPQLDETVARATVEWLAALPADVRPKLLPVQFSRIANALAQRWATPLRCSAYFDDLLIDKRGTRRGFTIGIVHELAVMKNYYENVVHQTPQTAWDEVSARIRER